MVLITCNERPSNGCRSRRIVTEFGMSRWWVVCSFFLVAVEQLAMLEAATKAGSGSAERRENGLGERVRSRRGRKARRHGDCASLADHAGDLTYLHPGGERRCHWR